MLASTSQPSISQRSSHPSILGDLFVKKSRLPNDRLPPSSVAKASRMNALESDEERFDGEDLSRVGYLPTPEEIAKGCAMIRAEWSLCEKRRRFVGDLMPDEPESVWRPPTIDTSHFPIATGPAANESCF